MSEVQKNGRYKNCRGVKREREEGVGEEREKKI